MHASDITNACRETNADSVTEDRVSALRTRDRRLRKLAREGARHSLQHVYDGVGRRVFVRESVGDLLEATGQACGEQGSQRT